MAMAIVGIMIEAAMPPSQDLIEASRLGTAARKVLSQMQAYGEETKGTYA